MNSTSKSTVTARRHISAFVAATAALLLAALTVFSTAGSASAESWPAPMGQVDSVTYKTQSNGQVRVTVSGWTFDSHQPADVTQVIFWWQDPNAQNNSYTFPAALPRPDVEEAWGAIGGHGFVEEFVIEPNTNYFVRIRGVARGEEVLLPGGSFETGLR